MLCSISMTGISSSVSSPHPLSVAYPLRGTFVVCPPACSSHSFIIPCTQPSIELGQLCLLTGESWLRRIMIMRREYRYHIALSDCMATTFAKSWLWTQLLVFPEQAQWWLTEWDHCQLQILWTKTMIILQWTRILIAAKCVFSVPSLCSGLISNS